MALVLVRHGEVDIPGPFHGWIDRPLTAEGIKQAQNTALGLAGLKVFKLFTDDLMRAVQTAQEIAGVVGRPINFLPALRPWNTGELAGCECPYSDIIPFVELPKRRPEDGESLQTYLDRITSILRMMVMAKETYLVVGHTSTANVVLGLADTKGKAVNIDRFRTSEGIDPADAICIDSEWKPVLLKPKEPRLERPTRISKQAVLYMHVQGSHYQCKGCVTFIPGTERCLQHGPADVIKPYGQCGLFAAGKPFPGLKPTGAVTKLQSGYWDQPNGSSCGQCEYFLAERKDCLKVDPNSDGDDPGQILAPSCCNRYSPA